MPHTVDITVLGECVADIIRDSAGLELTYPGGSAANVAVGLARLGRRVAFYTCLGDDENGRLMRAHLESEEVDFVNIAAAGTPTPSAIAVLNASGSASYTFSVEWVTQELVLEPRAPHLHLGSFPAFLADEPGDLDERLQNLQGRCSVSLDPNVRPELMADPVAARARLEALLGWVDIIKASDEDIAWLYPGADPDDVAREWIAGGASLAVVTRGADGCFAVNRSGASRVASVPVTVVDTVGAGDTLMAALIDGLAGAGALGAGASTQLAALDREVVNAVLHRSARAAGINSSRAGANPPTLADLDD